MTTFGFVGPMPPIRSGIAHHSSQLVAGLREVGVDVEVHSWCSQYPSALYKRSQVDPGAVADPSVRWTLKWWDPTSWIATGRSLRYVDRLIIPWTVPFHAPHYLTVAKSAGVPVTLMVHNALPHESMVGARQLTAPMMRRAERIVTQSRSVQEDCLLLAPHTPVSVVPAPPTFPLETKPLPPAPVRLLVLGYIRDYKGVDVALEAMRLLVESGQELELTVAGEVWDGDTQRWYALVERLGLSDRVNLCLQYQSNAAVSELVAGHHLLVAPYRSATQSGVVAQALAAGRPVVASRVGGLPDQVHEGVNGALATAGDAGSLAEAICRAASDIDALSAGALAGSPSWSDVARVFVAPNRVEASA
ncbi:MAG: glycosyltransferase [Acidimicrobiales bacterium]